jgi:DNA (cytosine-5)-methyltransferase 1
MMKVHQDMNLAELAKLMNVTADDIKYGAAKNMQILLLQHGHYGCDTSEVITRNWRQFEQWSCMLMDRLITPWPIIIKLIRDNHHLTQAQAASIVYVDIRTWQRWEAGDRNMPRAIWEFFQMRVVDGQIGESSATSRG